MFISKITLERHFKTRPYGEIYYPYGGRSGPGFTVSDQTTSAGIRRNIKIIYATAPFIGIPVYFLFTGFLPQYVSLIAAFAIFSVFGDLFKVLLLKRLAATLPKSDETLSDDA